MSALPNKIDDKRVRMGVSNYEQVSSLLIATLVMVGTVVGLMLVIVMSMRTFKIEKAVPVTFVPIEEGYGRGDHEAGTARDEKNSQVDEIDEFLPPPDPTQQMDTVTAVISTDLTILDNFESRMPSVGTGTGKGDSRPPGPLGEGNADVVPRWERWQVRFASADIKAYAQQLDFFKIELAAIGGGKDTVDYASNLSQPNPTRRTGNSGDEKRLYMTWRSGELIEADKSLLAKAGIDTTGRVVLQLYSPEAEGTLAGLEQQKLGMRQIRDIKRTVFGIRNKPGGYEFYVISQEYRFAS